MNYYEKLFILNPNLDDEAVEQITGRIRDIIIKQGGEILKEENWGRRKLAYELNKHQKGNYTLLVFKAPSSTILELEKVCKVLDSVLKFMIIRLGKKKEIEAALPSPADTSAKTEAAKPGQKESTEAETEPAPQEEK